MILVVKENAKLRPALAILAGVPITQAKEAIDTPLLVADEKSCQILVKIIKSSNIFTTFFTHQFSFTSFCNKKVFNFVDLV